MVCWLAKMLQNLMRDFFRVFKFLLFKFKYNVTFERYIKNNYADTIIFTHNLGGGTEQYVKNSFSNINCLIIRNVAPYRRFGFSIIENTISNQKMFISNNNISILFSYYYKNVVINSVTDDFNALYIIKLCVELKNKSVDTHLLYLIHDYNSICPTNFLIAKGAYCGCKCNFFQCKTNPPIREWRKCWQIFLQSCNEIRCFSNSSKDILTSVYPELSTDKITVIPHDMSYSRFAPIIVQKHSAPVVAVVGRCVNVAKGSTVILLLLNKISEKVRVVFVGTEKKELEGCIVSKNVVFLGKYSHDQLRDILVREKVTHTILPSICPETFSYLVSELIQMQLPIFCFNIGAQAEKVSRYEKGVVCSNIEEMSAQINQLV